MNEDLSPELSGKPGDPPQLAARENFNRQGINNWLDTPAGVALAAQYGSRQAAADAIYETDRYEQVWRRSQAEVLADRHPGRYPSVADAMQDVGRPPGGSGATLSGREADIVSMFRQVDPTSVVRTTGEDRDTTVIALGSQRPDGSYEPADTRPGWKR